jgi:hypothetical protein
MTETPRKKRGRPRCVPWDEILPWSKIVPDYPAGAMVVRTKGGRPADWDLNQALLEVANDAKRRGISLRAGVKEFLRKHGHPAEPDDVRRCERQINRLRRINRLRQSRALVGASNEKSR